MRGSTVATGTGGPTADKPRIEYRPCPNATPVAEARALATVYAYILNRRDSSRESALRDHYGEHVRGPFEQFSTKEGSS